ncbi:MAG: GTPase [Deltaproteobacteria bacterium]|nr:GTPase [Candidatus Anaeroferrophillus wilburensis]MBN2888239.1 GTPase [Deltaproteobacteria bacterium]
MAIFNYQKKEIGAKIVYYGPALCGKTTNVQYIHVKLNPKQRGDLVSLATDADRTLFFDFLPIELENIGGFKTRFHIYTVPGQVYYNSTRKAVLTGADGIIFVADSRRSMAQENIESLQNLKDNLTYYNRDIDSLPLIFQYNKRDMPDILSVAELNAQLNPKGLPCFESVAVKGSGVLPALTSCCKMVLQNLKTKGSATAKTAPDFPPKPSIDVQEQKAATPTLSSMSAPPHLESPMQAAMSSQLPNMGLQPPGVRLSPAGGFKPEVVRVGKVILNDPYTITVPLQVAVNENRNQLLSVDISLTINHLLNEE